MGIKDLKPWFEHQVSRHCPGNMIGKGRGFSTSACYGNEVHHPHPELLGRQSYMKPNPYIQAQSGYQHLGAKPSPELFHECPHLQPCEVGTTPVVSITGTRSRAGLPNDLPQLGQEVAEKDSNSASSSEHLTLLPPLAMSEVPVRFWVY